MMGSCRAACAITSPRAPARAAQARSGPCATCGGGRGAPGPPRWGWGTPQLRRRGSGGQRAAGGGVGGALVSAPAGWARRTGGVSQACRRGEPGAAAGRARRTSGESPTHQRGGRGEASTRAPYRAGTRLHGSCHPRHAPFVGCRCEEWTSFLDPAHRPWIRKTQLKGVQYSIVCGCHVCQ